MITRFGLLLAPLLLLLVGCGGSDALTGEPVPNAPPDTRVTGTPPVLSQTGFKVSFFWTGLDRDGTVESYQWRISNNGRDGIVDITDTLEVFLPWRSTTRTDSTFIVSAEIDSFEIDVDDPRQGPDQYRFWQTHTFFVRAVDDEGRADPTAAQVSFTATTLAPTITIDTPRYIPFNSCVSASQVLTFGWEGDDPDNPEREPAEVRYLLYPWAGPEEACLTETEYRALSPIRRDDPRWSEWIRYDAAQDSGRIVTLERQEVGNSFLFAVQARDVAGAVTPTFTWGRNVRHVRIGVDKFPVLNVSERFLGESRFVSTNGFKTFQIVSGQPLEFEIRCDASDYAGIVEAYRYGWNMVDPNDPSDPGWAVAWGNGPSWRRPQVRSFAQGSPNLVVQCRDNSGTISRAFYQFDVIQIAERADQRNLLLIDDWRDLDTPEGRALDQEWDRQWEDLLNARVAGFQSSDVIDAQVESARLGFANVNEYKSVIWFTNAADQSFLHTRLAPETRTRPRYNWLEIYQARVGNLLLVGPGAGFASLEREGLPLFHPIIFNVTAGGQQGFGTAKRADGTTYNVGTIRWPYTAWCVDLLNVVRPGLGEIFNENPGRRLRVLDCDALYTARTAPDLEQFYPDSDGRVVDLRPSPSRRSVDPRFQFDFEEIYNRNPTNREVTFVVRDCQTPMFLHQARRDAPGVVSDPTTCPPPGSSSSALSGGTVGLLSRRYADSKQLRGSEDVLWGFHPLAFDPEDVGDALAWILESRWELPIRR